MNRISSPRSLWPSPLQWPGPSSSASSAKLRADEKPPEGSSDLLAELKTYPHKLVYESNRDGNLELYLCNADGSNPVNLTNTKDVDELYPKPSPDGTKICFVADEGKGDAKIRNIYYMNSDGTGRIKIADNGREPCWSPDGTKIAYMKGEFEKFTYSDTATKGLFIYDLKTGKTREHVNNKLHASLHAQLVARRQLVRRHGSRRHGLSPHHPGHRGRRRQGLTI